MSRHRRNRKPRVKKSNTTMWFGIIALVGVLITAIFALSPKDSSTKKHAKKRKQSSSRVASSQKDVVSEKTKQKTIEDIEHDGKEREYSCAKLTTSASTADPSAAIKKHKGFSAIRSFVLVEGENEKQVNFEDLTLVQKHAVWVFIQNYALGVEWDFILKFKNKKKYLVSVFLDHDGTLRVYKEVPHTAPKNLLSSKEIQRKYNLGPLIERSSKWSTQDYAVLETSLATLSPDEIKVLKDMPIVREKDQSGINNDKTGLYTYKNNYAEILLFDKLYNHLEQGFSGTPLNPFNLGDVTLVHEIGHAIANYPYINWAATQQQSVLEYNNIVKSIKGMNRRVSTQSKEYIEYQQKKKTLETKKSKLELAKSKSKEYAKLSPVIEAFVAIRSFENGPTEYSNTSPDEAFAEAFAMFRLDPTALKRIDPKLFFWFDNNEHTRIMNESLPSPLPELTYTKP